MSVGKLKTALKNLRAANRSFARAARATTCSLARTNFRFGQQQMQRGWVQGKAFKKGDFEKFSRGQAELLRTQGELPSHEDNAFQNMLDKCGSSRRLYQTAAAEDRARSEGAADRARERNYRKRPKRNR